MHLPENIKHKTCSFIFTYNYVNNFLDANVTAQNFQNKIQQYEAMHKHPNNTEQETVVNNAERSE